MDDGELCVGEATVNLRNNKDNKGIRYKVNGSIWPYDILNKSLYHLGSDALTEAAKEI